MIHSIFVINNTGDVVIEKHYRAAISRVVLDPFFEEQTKADDQADVNTCIQSGRHYLISVLREGLFFLAVVQNDVQPLFITEFLHRVVDTFIDYFGKCTEKKLSSETVVVYQVLEEMLDNGFPLSTELNVLKEMVRPPNWSNALSDAMKGKKRVKDTLPSGQLTATQWRRQGVRYANNEMFVDFVEEIDAIIGRQGAVISSEINGAINCNCRLTGSPDLTLSFSNARLMDAPTFHPSVRLSQWSAERVLSFVPPDGKFTLCNYSVSTGTMALPIYVKPLCTFDKAGGRFEFEVGSKQNIGKPIEDVVLRIPFPRTSNNIRVTSTSVGVWRFDQFTNTLIWEIKKLGTDKLPIIRGTTGFANGATSSEAPTVTLSFNVQGYNVSGLKVNRLDIYGVTYKPFKGVKYITKSGDFQVRA